jgi:gas vesicle protein
MNKEYNQLVETNNQLNEDLFTSKGEAMAKYAEIMATYGEQLEKSGFTKEEIEAWAREASGLDKLNQNGSQKALVQDIKNSADAAFSTVETVYQKELNSIFGQNVVNTFTGYGETYAKAIGEGFIKSFKNVLTSIKDALKTLRNEIQIELEYILSHIKSVLNEELELTVTIRPVLDMSDIGYGPLGSLVADALTVDVSESRNRALQVASSPNSGSATGATSNQPNSVYFVQNNYSPKALSRIDIYRQTKNQISTLKELVNA